jgi:hypothetical protein
MAANKGLVFKAKWDSYVNLLNSRAPTSAKFAWHSASVWVRSEAQIAILSSTLDTVLIECGLSWLGITWFTGDPLIATLVLGIVLVNISGLLFVMTVVLGWALGPIEVVFLIVFLGYSVTYGLHLVSNYAAVTIHDDEIEEVERRFPAKPGLRFRSTTATMEAVVERDKDPPNHDSETLSANADAPHTGGDSPYTPFSRNSSISKTQTTAAMPERELRFVRTRIAVLHVGSALLSSTVSTVGSSVFLLMCSMNVFIRLGFVVITVVVLSILMTLISLPAVLMVFGPRADPCYKRIPRQRMRGFLGLSREPDHPAVVRASMRRVTEDRLSRQTVH